MKKCNKCQKLKAIESFVVDKIKKGGHSNRCKICDKLYRSRNKKRIKAYYSENKEKFKLRYKIYDTENKDKRRKRDNKRLHIDPMFRLNKTMSRGLYNSLKKNKNGKQWNSFVDYDLSELRKHLEKQFTEGMTWENYGKNGWELDHKIPRSVFNFTKPAHEDFKRCWALKNLQPLWASDNLQKSNKLDKHFQPSLLL